MRRDGRRDIRYIERTLRARSVGIVFNLTSPWDHSNVVGASRSTLSVPAVALLTRMAEAGHMSVEYRPLIKVDHGSRWEGYVEPSSQAAWFNSYFAAERPYLKLAERLHVREFVLGTEMVLLNDSPEWPGFIKRVRRIYHGIVSYASYGSQYYPNGRYLPPTGEYGVTAYPDFRLPNSASVAALVRDWTKVFSTVPAAIRYRTAVDEIGIPALDGAYLRPWKWTTTGTLNETVQARWFTSACKAVIREHLRGIYFFNVNLTDDPYHPPYPSPPTFEGKKGATAIRGCARIFRRARLG